METFGIILFWFDYIYILGIAFTFLLFNMNIFHLTKLDENDQEYELTNPIIQGLFCLGFPIIWYKCYKNWKKEKEEDS